MGLYKRGKVWWIAFTVDGRQQRRSTGQESKAKAEEVWARVKTSLIDGSYVPEGKRKSVLDCPTFSVAVESYIEQRIAEGKNESSYDSLRGPWHTQFGHRQLDTITSEEIEAKLRAWQADKNWSNATRNNRLNQLAGLFSYAYGRRWIDAHPTEKGRVSKLRVNNERDRWLRTEELRKLCNEARKKKYRYLVAIIRFGASTGMRLGEICGLNRASFERDSRGRAFLTVSTTKNGEPLCWPLEGKTLRLVERRLASTRFPGDLLFPGPNGGNARSSVTRHFRKVVEASELEWGPTRTGITFHSLRHTMASLALNAGMSVEEVAEMGNWRDSRMVRRYGRFSNERLRRSAARLASIVGGRESHNITGRVETTKPQSGIHKKASS